MKSRLFVRTVLVAFIAASLWALRWTWTADLSHDSLLAFQIMLILIESSVLVAALSLLFESFRSFAEISVKRDSWSYILFGFKMFDEGREVSSVNARTCAQFGVRSVLLTGFSFSIAMCLAILYQVAKSVISFLSNPYVPVISWHEVLSFIGIAAIPISVSLLITVGFVLIEEKIVGRVIKTVALVLYFSVAFGLVMGVVEVLSSGGFGLPLYQAVLMATGVGLGLASFFGAVFGMAYGIYRLVGNASQKFPVLRNVWNQLCPVRTINFE